MKASTVGWLDLRVVLAAWVALPLGCSCGRTLESFPSDIATALDADAGMPEMGTGAGGSGTSGSGRSGNSSPDAPARSSAAGASSGGSSSGEERSTVPGAEPGLVDGERDPVTSGDCSRDVDCQNRSLCDGQERCRDRKCVPGQPVRCNDDLCNGTESCSEEQGGICVPGAPLDCGVSSPCQQASCDPKLGCVRTAVEDGVACSAGATCLGGACVAGRCASDSDCDDGVACNGIERCNVALRRCLPSPPFDCDDGNACNGKETCVESPIGPQCMAGNPLDCQPSLAARLGL